MTKEAEGEEEEGKGQRRKEERNKRERRNAKLLKPSGKGARGQEFCSINLLISFFLFFFFFFPCNTLSIQF